MSVGGWGGVSKNTDMRTFVLQGIFPSLSADIVDIFFGGGGGRGGVGGGVNSGIPYSNNYVLFSACT